MEPEGGVLDGVGVLTHRGESLIVEYSSFSSSSTAFSETEPSSNASEYTCTLASPLPLEPCWSLGTGGRGIFPRPFTAMEDFLFSGGKWRGLVGGGVAAVPPLTAGTGGDETPF